jgi:hypothetical protein
VERRTPQTCDAGIWATDANARGVGASPISRHTGVTPLRPSAPRDTGSIASLTTWGAHERVSVKAGRRSRLCVAPDGARHRRDVSDVPARKGSACRWWCALEGRTDAVALRAMFDHHHDAR